MSTARPEGVSSRAQRGSSRAQRGISILLFGLALASGLPPAAAAQDTALPKYLRDRGPGVATSMFGSYVRKGQLLVYPFFEWYADSNLEYNPDELGYTGTTDYRGRYRASEGLFFLGYGLTRNLAVELEVAVISASLRKASDDPSEMPAEVRESGLGDVEAQLRWRFGEETLRRPEAFVFFETVFPFQRSKRLIGTPDWEFKLGVGLIKGLSWGTLTVRAAAEYSRDERKFDVGEYAVEYLRRLSDRWKLFGMIEGNQLDEVALITGVEWRFLPRAFLKLNNGWGLTSRATDFAPEIGIMIAF